MARDHRFSTAGETAVRENTAKFRWQVLRRHVEDGTPLTQLAGLEGIGVPDCCRLYRNVHAARIRNYRH
ncbi:MAG: hypothetical protein L0K46_11170 [Yaniella sp.]|nr:hypothetical protein [Yaniella sp.]